MGRGPNGEKTPHQKPEKSGSQSSEKKEKDALLEKEKLSWKKSKHFLNEIELCNSMPDPLNGPVYLDIPIVTADRMGSWCSSSFDQKYVWSMNPLNHLGGVRVEMIDPSEYIITGSDQREIHPDDAVMVNWRDTRGKRKTGRGIQPDEPWLLKSKMDSHRMYKDVDNDDATVQSSSSIVVDLTRNDLTGPRFDSSLGNDKQQKIDLIASSFIDLELTIANRTDIEWSVDVLPDAELWGEDLIEVSIGTDYNVQLDEDAVKRTIISLGGSLNSDIKPLGSSSISSNAHNYGSMFSSSASSASSYSRLADYRLDRRQDTSSNKASCYLFRISNNNNDSDDGSSVCLYSSIKNRMDLRVVKSYPSSTDVVSVSRRELTERETSCMSSKLRLISDVSTMVTTSGTSVKRENDDDDEEVAVKTKKHRIVDEDDDDDDDYEDDGEEDGNDGNQAKRPRLNDDDYEVEDDEGGATATKEAVKVEVRQIKNEDSDIFGDSVDGT